MGDQSKYTSKLKGSKVLVIGGSSGIGFGVAEAALEHGATVTISSSNSDRIQASLGKLHDSYPSAKDRVSGQACDIGGADDTIEGNLKDLLDKVTGGGESKLDHIVWTAGSPLAVKSLAEIDVAFVRKAGTTRFVGPLLLAKLAPKYLNAGPASSITLTTGSVSERPRKNWSVINSYATGLQGMARGLALDLAPIRVNVISPGAVDTELWQLPAEAKEKFFADIRSHVPTGEVGKVVDVAESYLYLMKDHNITGAMISTNAGHLLVG